MESAVIVSVMSLLLSSAQLLSISSITMCLYRYVVYKDITMVLSSNIPVHMMDDHILSSISLKDRPPAQM